MSPKNRGRTPKGPPPDISTVGLEANRFDTSMVADYLADRNNETHDRRHGVRYYKPSPSYKFPFPKYPSIDEANKNLIPLHVDPSFESRLFGRDKDEFDSSTPDYVPPRLGPWTLPIVDAPSTITPRALYLRAPRSLKPAAIPSPADILAGFIDPSLSEKSHRDPPPTNLPSLRPTIALPSRVQQLRVAPSLPPASAQSASDYSGVLGNGKRKAVNSPAPRPQKKPQSARPFQVSNNPPKPSPFICGIDQCPDAFDSKESLQRHRQLHVPSGHRFRCTGCPAVYAQLQDLHVHMAHDASCTSELAARRLQMFYLHPTIIARNPATLAQKDLSVPFLGALRSQLY
ncbi:hypothetical protein B0H17DRAFT_1215869 [Mycena rosella]|uniref:C2H2-type domain-containing protein n=1 Tax=Mycena rosella TaxID=1033263 RepID=A0AAD7FVM7_MYCRO|nr:hypothetical protein B0H17DRAFT_1215869 [Mycena rosella]